MRCFYHEDRDSIGICKSCGKGLCKDCAVDLVKGLACKGDCEQVVRDMIALIDQNIRLQSASAAAMRQIRPNYISNGLLLVFMGGFLIVLGFKFSIFMPYLLVFGVPIILFGLYWAWRARYIPE